jgi:steroid delta-isomerase-like uncharacterized protein
VATPEHNKAQAQRWFEEVWCKRRSEAIFEMLGPDTVGRTEMGDMVGPEPFAQVHAAFLAAFPDLRLVVESIATDQDLVAIRWSASGTHHGEFLGVPASNKHVHFKGTTWHRYQDGRLIEGWDDWNMDGLRRRLTEG